MTGPDAGPERRQAPRTSDEPDFLELVTRRERGKLKLYIGSAAGVGKTFRMLNEGHELRARGVDVVVGFIETHGRIETTAQLRDLEVIPRQKIEYRGVVLEEMDVAAVIARRPQIAIVDELAHTNVPGVHHRRRWEDVVELLDAGINVISALNVQHIESLNDIIASTLGVTVRETVPDWVVTTADQVVNLDISAEDLRERLRAGKIYAADKIDAALRNFFTDENLTTLRELALREVASSVDRTREAIVRRETGTPEPPRTVDRILVAMSSSPPYTAALLRKASRIAGRLNSDWYCVYVQTPEERPDRIDSAVQRKLVDNIQLAQSMGAEVVKLQGEDVAASLTRFAREKGVTLLIVGQSRQSGLRHLMKGSVVQHLVNNSGGLDILVVSFRPPDGPFGTTRSMKIAHRMYLMVVPAILGVLVVAALAYWGQYAHTVPHLVLIIAAVAVVGTAILAWSNASYVAERIERLAGSPLTGGQAPTLRDVASAVVPRRIGTSPDELDAIEFAVDRLSSAVEVAESDRAAREHAFEVRARDYATMLAIVAETATKKLEEVRLPLHILLDNHFGDLNENQEEMLGSARAAAEAADADLVSLRQIAELDLGTRTLRRDRFSPGDMVRTLLPTLQAAAEKAGATLHTEIEPLVPAIVGDQPRLHDALSTLLGDALSATAAGASIELDLRDSPAGARITLRATGEVQPNVRSALATRTIGAGHGTVERRAGELLIVLPHAPPVVQSSPPLGGS